MNDKAFNFIKKCLLILSLLIFVGCTAGPDSIHLDQPDINYEDEKGLNTNSSAFGDMKSTVCVTYEYYEDISDDKIRNISIKYPQVSGVNNADFLQKLNENLSPPYFEGDEDDQLTIEIWSDYAFVGDDILSFCFNRFINRFDAAHPYSYMWAVTVDIKTAEYLALSDVVRVNEDFKQLFLCGGFVSDRFSYEELLEFENLDTLYDKIYDFYLTENTLGVIASTNHAAGDYLTFEIPYTSITDLLHTKYRFLGGI